MALHPIDTDEQRRALAVSNRRVIAERVGWPDGALQACQEFDERHPGWYAWWLPPAGYTAAWQGHQSLVGGDEVRRGPNDGVARRPIVVGATVAALEERVEAMQARLTAVRGWQASERRLWAGRG
jgi:hypothetical protein